MFSVIKTELKVFPLCTKNVCPTKSGVTIERRDQVLIGFLAPALFILSIFSKRYDSTKGPFFNDLAIKIKLLFAPALENEAIARLVFAARLKTFGELPPWPDRMMPAAAAFRFSLAAAHWLLDRGRRHAADMWTPPTPAGATCFTTRY